MSQPTAIKRQIDSLLRQWMVSTQVMHIALIDTAKMGKMDKYAFVMQKQPQDVCEVFDYFTGIGLRDNGKPSSPHAANILEALVLDMTGTEYDFNGWCRENDRNSDSIEAHKHYLKALEMREQMLRVFNMEQITELRTLLED